MKQLTIIIIHTFLSCHKVITSEAVNVKMTELSESHRQGQKIADVITVYLYEKQNNIYVAALPSTHNTECHTANKHRQKY